MRTPTYQGLELQGSLATSNIEVGEVGDTLQMAL